MTRARSSNAVLLACAVGVVFVGVAAVRQLLADAPRLLVVDANRGTPIADAEASRVDAAVAATPFVSTDRDGVAILPEDAAPGAAWTVRADGYREAILAPDLVALRGTTTVRLVGTASFSGRVVAADGAPPDVAVRVRFGDCETGLGDDGLYRIDGVRGGLVAELSLAAADGRRWAGVAFADGETSIDLRLPDLPYVLDIASEESQEAARVKVTTGRDVLYEAVIDLERGIDRLRFEAPPSVADRAVRIDVEGRHDRPSLSETATPTLSNGIRRVGVVIRDPSRSRFLVEKDDGSPLIEERVWQVEAGASLTTDARGEVVASCRDEVRLYHPRYGVSRSHAPDGARVRLGLAGGGRIRCSVDPGDLWLRAGLDMIPTSFTEVHGVWVSGPLPPGAWRPISPHFTTSPGFVQVDVGSTVDVALTPRRADGRMTGTAREAGRVSLFASRDAPPLRERLVAAGERFAFEALEPARYHATFTGVDGGVERFTARTDEPSSRPFAPIPAHPRVPVRFEDADGAPLANVRILLRTDASRFEVTTGRDGVARIPKAPSQVLRFYRRDDRGDVVSSTELLADELDGDPTVVRTPLEALDVVIEGPVGVEFMNRLCVATRHGGRVWTEEVRPEAGQDRRRPRRAVVRGARAGDLVVMEGRGVAVGVLEPVRQGAAEILTVKAPHARPRPQTSIGSGAFTRIAGRPWPSALRFASLRIDERTSVYVPERPAGATDTAPSCAAEFTVARPDGREPKVCFGW